MKTMQIQSTVGSDGVLNLRVELGADEATHPVLVTIEAIEPEKMHESDRAEWRQFVKETYGSCAALGLERPTQREFEKREAIE